MEIRHLLKSQANQVFRAVRAAGLEPTDFEWNDLVVGKSTRPVSRLVHKSSNYYFTFNNTQGFVSDWSPGADRRRGGFIANSWGSQFKCFETWLSYLKREIESPDLWDTVSNEARILDSAASSETSNAPFTVQEKGYILSGLNEIKQYLLTAHKLDPELVESRLKYLVESSDRLGRKDWLNLLLSVLVSIVINAALPPDATRELFRFVGTALRQIINTPLLLR